MQAYSWLLYLGYRVQNHYLFDISLRDWLWVMMAAPLAVAALRYLSWWAAVPISLLGALLLLGTVWARRKGFFVFQPAQVDAGNPDRLPLRVDEAIACKACGTFAVGGKHRYLVNEDALLSYVHTREHILMAVVKRTRFLLLARSHHKDVGCWYVFFMPDRVRQITQGYLACGGRTRPGLALGYRPDDQPDREETVYVAFDDPHSMARTIADLRADAAESASVARL
jgi:hypothetical protein